MFPSPRSLLAALLLAGGLPDAARAQTASVTTALQNTATLLQVCDGYPTNGFCPRFIRLKASR